MKKAIVFSLLLILFECGKEKNKVPDNPSVSGSEDATWYATLFYFSLFGGLMYTPHLLVPTGDAWIMQGQTPAYNPVGMFSICLQTKYIILII